MFTFVLALYFAPCYLWCNSLTVLKSFTSFPKIHLLIIHVRCQNQILSLRRKSDKSMPVQHICKQIGGLMLNDICLDVHVQVVVHRLCFSTTLQQENPLDSRCMCIYRNWIPKDKLISVWTETEIWHSWHLYCIIASQFAYVHSFHWILIGIWKN
jgi:hypothetical protein